MPAFSHQTARLFKGKQHDPQHGVCVMELASLLAGERFTDRPRSVCPVIGGFLRTYNDLVGDEHRQDLYRFAAAAVGTNGSRAIRDERARRCLQWARMLQQQHAPRGPRRLMHRPRPVSPDPQLGPEAPGILAARTATVRRGSPAAGARHAAALRFVDELIALDRDTGRPSCSGRVSPAPR